MKKSHRLSGIILIALILTVATFAFAAANNVPTSNAGDGDEVISGYEITNVHYALNTTNPDTIQTVTFDISPDTATDIQIKLVDGGIWIDACSNVSGAVTCNVAGAVTALDADLLRVVAAD
ncbi:MAG: hypothetical protein RBT34_10185 [Anaerolineaceae bacterium]|nr:hypothetical protein [Anaerolineaceae bacterium]